MQPRSSRRPAATTGRPARPEDNAPVRISKGDPTPEGERTKAEDRAWDSLAGYKFFMFGYWCATWVQMNRLCAEKADNPWQELVALARRRTDRRRDAPKKRTR